MAGETPVRGAFRTTRWSLVLGAGLDDGSERAHTALATLCEHYWPPIFASFRRRGLDPERAADATQEFFAGVLSRGDLARADPARGRFRAWLYTALDHFLANQWQKENAQKRGGGQRALSLEVLEGLDPRSAEARFAREPRTDDPQRAFARSFALALLDRVLERLRGDYEAADQAALFAELAATLDRSTGPGQAGTQAQMAARLRMTPGAVKVAAHRMRARYRELLRAEIAETLPDPDDEQALEDEIRGLFEALGGA